MSSSHQLALENCVGWHNVIAVFMNDHMMPAGSLYISNRSVQCDYLTPAAKRDPKYGPSSYPIAGCQN